MSIRPLGFGCELMSVSFPAEQTVRFYLPENRCVHMQGCTEYALKLNPDVVRIETYSGAEKDTTYLLHRGAWVAL